ncbi:GNAT family acetyltransferase [Pandoraea sp. NPDC090278]|uniref:GNAT family acetyltransferase n=1 Tax=Pandoraea sp. NPDC090278 TaxID=3364391 RepID=UPI00383BD796
MMIVERLRAEHLLFIELQPAQAFAQALLTREYAETIAGQTGVGWTVLKDGKPVACGGVAEQWPGRAEAWTLLSDDALRTFRHVHRVAQGVIAEAPWNRIEMKVDARHDAGVRWAKRLGFECEGLMRKYTTDGRDIFLFARVK